MSVEKKGEGRRKKGVKREHILGDHRISFKRENITYLFFVELSIVFKNNFSMLFCTYVDTWAKHFDHCLKLAFFWFRFC